MKKLMIAAAALAVGFAAQAAQYNWAAADFCSGFAEKTDKENCAYGNVYVFIDGVNGVSYSAVMDAIAAGTFEADYVTTEKYLDFAATDPASGAAANGFKGADDPNYRYMDAFAVILSDTATEYMTGEVAEKMDSMYAYATDKVNIAEDPTALGGATIEFGSQYDQTMVPGGWTAQSVPEPTSGLLLLLGVAGLALRRRRA